VISQSLTVLLIAVGLAMDAFAVAASSGFAIQHLRVRYALRIALFFGVFQAVMPLLGWLSGMTVRKYIERFDHWIAFGLLVIIGAKMMYESGVIKRIGTDVEKAAAASAAWPGADPALCATAAEHSLYTLIILSVATSIDALIVGMSLSLLKVGIILSAAVIGVVTFVMALGGVYIGKRIGHFFNGRISAVGGLILIIIGIKIVLTH
jgi:putative Mn2+ efflux pump MntP